MIGTERSTGSHRLFDCLGFITTPFNDFSEYIVSRFRIINRKRDMILETRQPVFDAKDGTRKCGRPTGKEGKRMKHVLKGLVVAVAVSALVGVFLAVGYTQTVSEEVTKLRRESRSDLVYLRTRVRVISSINLSVTSFGQGIFGLPSEKSKTLSSPITFFLSNPY